MPGAPLFANSFNFLTSAALLRGEPVGFFGALPCILLFEAINAASRIDQFLFAGKKRMAVGADFDTYVAFVCGASLERVCAGTNHVHLVIGRVNSSFHSILGKSNLNTQTAPRTPFVAYEGLKALLPTSDF
jgi:hypothetical protein